MAPSCGTLRIPRWAVFAMYGKPVRLAKDKEESLQAFQPAIRAGLCVPQSTGELILLRQHQLLQCLNIIIEDVLEEGSTTRSKQQRPKKPVEAASAALFKLSIKATPSKLDLPDLQNSALDQKASLGDALNLLCTKPVVFAHAVNVWFFNRPELVPDERGRMLPAHTDKYISAATLDAVHSAVKSAAIWNYMCRLLEILKGLTDKSHRAIVLQEISNLCRMEYTRAQAIFKRHVSTGTGSKWFKRVSNAFNNGNARVIMKGNPELLTREDPQLHYMLRLCQPETNASKAVDWIKKLDDLHKSHPGDKESLHAPEIDALCDLAIIVGFIHSLSPTIAMPSFNRKKGQLFVSSSAELETELNQLKSQIDLGDFVIPIDNLLEPGMTEDALKTLDQFIVEKTGTRMGFLYQELIGDPISRLQEQLRAKSEHETKAEYVPLPAEAAQRQEIRVQQRKQKEKTRPAHSSMYEITSSDKNPALKDVVITQPPQPFKVKDSTATVFPTLFSRSESRGSVTWAGFEAAMADLGFSVMPKFGSVYTFLPPKDMPVQKSVTFHRPHKFGNRA
ncbi:hypothetical protein DL762_000611 [Monosporascus cannonballus]|uniref:Uncharacterized protein n=1 Tax=Monosporascus cannonballus TaxID=155416 RepID=A0ABY0HMV5_9PEZI|nr:hypothetical protein DL762_000611 [Monosporascus cannonballus]